jgi:hypothetical protein
LFRLQEKIMRFRLHIALWHKGLKNGPELEPLYETNCYESISHPHLTGTPR